MAMPVYPQYPFPDSSVLHPPAQAPSMDATTQLHVRIAILENELYHTRLDAHTAHEANRQVLDLILRSDLKALQPVSVPTDAAEKVALKQQLEQAKLEAEALRAKICVLEAKCKPPFVHTDPESGLRDAVPESSDSSTTVISEQNWNDDGEDILEAGWGETEFQQEANIYETLFPLTGWEAPQFERFFTGETPLDLVKAPGQPAESLLPKVQGQANGEAMPPNPAGADVTAAIEHSTQVRPPRHPSWLRYAALDRHRRRYQSYQDPDAEVYSNASARAPTLEYGDNVHMGAKPTGKQDSDAAPENESVLDKETEEEHTFTAPGARLTEHANTETRRLRSLTASDENNKTFWDGMLLRGTPPPTPPTPPSPPTPDDEGAETAPPKPAQSTRPKKCERSGIVADAMRSNMATARALQAEFRMGGKGRPGTGAPTNHADDLHSPSRWVHARHQRAESRRPSARNQPRTTAYDQRRIISYADLDDDSDQHDPTVVVEKSSLTPASDSESSNIPGPADAKRILTPCVEDASSGGEGEEDGTEGEKRDRVMLQPVSRIRSVASPLNALDY